MSAALAGLLVRLHDRAWRDRFGAECRELLVELPASPGVLADMALSVAVSRRPILLHSATAAVIALLLAVSATLVFGHGAAAAGVAVMRTVPASAQPN
jgi:hypothetical protein